MEDKKIKINKERKTPEETFNKVEQDKKTLNDEYYGNKTLMTNYGNFALNIKKDINKDKKNNDRGYIDTDESKLFYDNQGVRQVFKPLTDDKIHTHILSFYPFESIYLDTMYLRLANSTLAFINCVDLFSKYAFSKMYIIKHKAQAVSSKDSSETLQDFFKDIKQYGYDIKDVGIVYVDDGNEFKKNFTDYLNTNNILNECIIGNKRKTSPIERFNRTLRLYLQKYRVVKGKIDSDVLKTILNSYNNQRHAHLKYTPIEILENKNNQLEVEEHYIDLKKENKHQSLKAGQSVRILLEQTPFRKIKPVWSKEVYKIKKVLGNGSYYELEGLYKPYNINDLQPINDKFLLNNKKVDFKLEDFDENNNDFAMKKSIPIVKEKSPVFRLEEKKPPERIRTGPKRYEE